MIAQGERAAHASDVYSRLLFLLLERAHPCLDVDEFQHLDVRLDQGRRRFRSAVAQIPPDGHGGAATIDRDTAAVRSQARLAAVAMSVSPRPLARQIVSVREK
jgi:hypothetical protein